METWKSHEELAIALSDTFSVHLPDRRGRGQSVSSTGASLQTEVNDLEALNGETGARFVFGVSFARSYLCRQRWKRRIFQQDRSLRASITGQSEAFQDLHARFQTELDWSSGHGDDQEGPWLFRRCLAWRSRVNWACPTAMSKACLKT